MSFPAAECEAGAACATQTDSACRTRPTVKGEERQRPLTGGRGGRQEEAHKRLRITDRGVRPTETSAKPRWVRHRWAACLLAVFAGQLPHSRSLPQPGRWLLARRSGVLDSRPAYGHRPIRPQRAVCRKNCVTRAAGSGLHKDGRSSSPACACAKNGSGDDGGRRAHQSEAPLCS